MTRRTVVEAVTPQLVLDAGVDLRTLVLAVWQRCVAAGCNTVEQNLDI